MKPMLSDGRLTVELNKHELAVLAKAREIGATLAALHQTPGDVLVAAIDAVVEVPEE